MKTCLSLLLAILLSTMVALPADAPAPAPKPLETSDRLLVRDGQLYLAQAHIARLQAETQVRQAEDNLKQIISTLKKQYGCLECELNTDFTWKLPAPSEPVTTPAPGGQSEQKE